MPKLEELVAEAEREADLAKSARSSEERPLGFERWRDEVVAARGALAFLLKIAGRR